jgi:two-component system response regulator RegA
VHTVGINSANDSANDSSPDTRPGLLLVDDNEQHCWAMRRAFEKRGYAVQVANSVPMACDLLEEGWAPEYAVVDLKMPGPSGLELLPRLKSANANARIVVLTGYASIATAVQAVKLGATYYLIKPTDAEQVEIAFHEADGEMTVAVNERPVTVGRLQWEHIQQVLAEYRGNVSATARALGMHRRSLQRKLQKNPSPT